MRLCALFSPRFARPVIRVVGDTSTPEVVAGIGTWRWTLPSSTRRTESDEGKEVSIVLQG